MSVSYMGDLSENIIESADISGRSRGGSLRRLMAMSPAQRLAAFRRLPKWKRVLLVASAPALFPFAARPSAGAVSLAMQIRRRRAARLRGDDVELLGGPLKNWVKKMRSMSPAQKKAAWKKMPWWKKALTIAAAPALVATAAASLPVLLPTAAAVGTAAASAKLTKKATIALAKKVAAARAAVSARNASRADRNAATVAAIESTNSGTPKADISAVREAASAVLLPFPLSVFSRAA